MTLTKKDKEFLRSIGYQGKDFLQIVYASGGTDYEYNGSKISRKKAIDLLGRHAFLSGLARSAFHWSACQVAEDGSFVLFDSSRWFNS